MRSIDLPDEFEKAIQDTEVTKQGIKYAEAKKQKNLVVQSMYVEQANIAQQATINEAKGKAEAKKIRADAQAGTFLNVTKAQAIAYNDLKNNLSFQNKDLIEFIQTSLINNNNQGNIVISLKEAV